MCYQVTQHVLKCEKAIKFTLREESNKREWEQTTKMYRKNKKMRKVAVTQVQNQSKITREDI